MPTSSFRTLAFLVALLVACGDTQTSRTEGRGSGRPGASREEVAALEMRQRMQEKDAAANQAAPERDLSASVGYGAGAAGSRTPPQAPSPAGIPQGRADTASVPSMLIRTGNATVEVDSLEIAMQQVRDLAQRLGGYVANTQLSSGRDQIRSATLEMKIPAARWADAVSGLKPIGKVEALNEFSEDVGEEYVDVTARVQNAKRLEARLIELLANRTGRLSDVLAVERELARVREEIERYEGRLRFLRSRAAMSSLSVNVHEEFPVVSARGESGVLGDAFKQAWRNFVSFIAGIISLTGILIPLAALGVLAWFGWRRWGPRRPPKSSSSEAKP